MNKMKLAHDHAIKYMDSYLGDIETLVSVSWKYADLMFEQEEKRKEKGVPDAIEQEWQPDWSQAPADDITHWSKDGDGVCTWWVGETTLADGCHCEHNFGNGCSVFSDAPDFGYQGDWRKSLRKRPEGK